MRALSRAMNRRARIRCPSFRRGHARRAARDFLSPEFREAAISDSGAIRSPHVHDVRLVDTFAVTFRDSTKF